MKRAKRYEPLGCGVSVVRIKDMWVKLKTGENGNELVDQITALIRRYSEDGDWVFHFNVEQ